jgi:hypothetical protein
MIPDIPSDILFAVGFIATIFGAVVAWVAIHHDEI